MTPCDHCKTPFPKEALDFLGRCEPCFRRYINNLPPDVPLLFRSTHNRHNRKETAAYVQRLERKCMTPQGIDHNYVRRSYA